MDRVNNLGKFEMVIMMEWLGLTGCCARFDCEAVVLLFCGWCRRRGGAWLLVLWHPGGGTVQRCTFSKHGCSRGGAPPATRAAHLVNTFFYLT